MTDIRSSRVSLDHTTLNLVGSNIDTYDPEAIKVGKAAKIRKRYNQVPHLTQDTSRGSNKNTRGQPLPSR